MYKGWTTPEVVPIYLFILLLIEKKIVYHFNMIIAITFVLCILKLLSYLIFNVKVNNVTITNKRRLNDIISL